MGAEKEYPQERSVTLQIVLGLIAYCTSIAPSMSIGFSAVALPALFDPDNPNRLTSNEASWFASIASIATPIGCFLSGPISDRFGRKFTLLAVNLVTFAGWVILALAYNMTTSQYTTLLIGRILTGMSTGLASMPASVYMAEISSPKLRGMFTTASAIFFAFGILIVYFLGYIFKNDWGTICTITAAIPCCAMFAGLIFLPESPAWLISKNRDVEATDCMRKIYGFSESNQQIRDEISALIRNRDTTKITNAGAKKTMLSSFMKKISYLKRPTCFKPFVVVLTYFFFQQFSGTFVVVFYAINIVEEAGVTIDPYAAIVVIAFTRFVGALFISYVSRKYGRRPVSIISGAGMSLGMLALAVYLYVKHKGFLSEDFLSGFSWIPLSTLLFYFFASMLGYMTMPFAMAAECFPAKIRGLATGLITCIAYIFNFIIVKIYPAMLEAMEAHGLFFFYGTVAALGTVFIVFWLPETKGKTLAEIEEYFGKKKKDRNCPERDEMLKA